MRAISHSDAGLQYYVKLCAQHWRHINCFRKVHVGFIVAAPFAMVAVVYYMLSIAFRIIGMLL